MAARLEHNGPSITRLELARSSAKRTVKVARKCCCYTAQTYPLESSTDSPSTLRGIM